MSRVTFEIRNNVPPGNVDRIFAAIGIDIDTNPQDQRAVLNLIREIYNPLLHNALSWGTDWKKMFNGKKTADIKGRFTARHSELPASVLAHVPDPVELNERLWDVLRFYRFTDPAWRVTDPAYPIYYLDADGPALAPPSNRMAAVVAAKGIAAKNPVPVPSRPDKKSSPHSSRRLLPLSRLPAPAPTPRVVPAVLPGTPPPAFTGIRRTDVPKINPPADPGQFVPGSVAGYVPGRYDVPSAMAAPPMPGMVPDTLQTYIKSANCKRNMDTQAAGQAPPPQNKKARTAHTSKGKTEWTTLTNLSGSDSDKSQRSMDAGGDIRMRDGHKPYKVANKPDEPEPKAWGAKMRDYLAVFGRRTPDAGRADISDVEMKDGGETPEEDEGSGSDKQHGSENEFGLQPKAKFEEESKDENEDNEDDEEDEDEDEDEDDDDEDEDDDDDEDEDEDENDEEDDE
ncbi:hypothetical protein N7447_003990 [Penicillium robsamsonii]|uniref:uncharacterized protein n=1 Tax=Penicillium robsamsonii TaxID=1792511 RepID=UPI002549198B|nr:uncharacterized protein N7447_003990 [Penicillium robsamsonii]KAJ5827227.1 hypothetical protein N7447_003990 [Penicillium robsamsonii]